MNSQSEPVGDCQLGLIVEKLDVLLRRESVPVVRYFSTSDAARYTGFSEKSIRRLLKRGVLTELRPLRGAVRIDRQQIDALMLGSIQRPRGGRGSASRDRRANGEYLGDTEPVGPEQLGDDQSGNGEGLG